MVVAETIGLTCTCFGEKATYAGDYGVMACEVGLAGFAAENFVGVQVGVVDEAHGSLLRDFFFGRGPWPVAGEFAKGYSIVGVGVDGYGVILFGLGADGC